MEFLEGFVAYIRNEKRFSDLTLKAYIGDLNQFSDYTKMTYEVGSPEEINTSMARSWVIHLMDQGVSPRSVNRKLSALKTFFRYLMRESKIAKNPVAGISSPKVKKRLPSYLENEEMVNLFGEDNFEDSFTGIRNRLVMLLFYCTGMRRSELIGLTIQAYDKYQKTVKVLGKGNKERVIPISAELTELIDLYLVAKEQEFGASAQACLLVTDNGKQLYPNYVYRVVKAHLSKVSTTQKKSPHVLRHTFATHMLNNGADLNSIKEILGHANLSATQIYTHSSVEKLKKIYKQAHPRA